MERDRGRDYHLVDLGAGGCDIPVWLLRTAERRRIDVRVTALDGDPRAVAFARARYGNIDRLTIQTGDLMSMDQFGPVDYIFTNHVLHHLPDDLIPDVLRKMQQTARRRWIVSDLKRSAWSYAGFQVLGRFFRNSFAFEDGKRSIRRGFVASDFQRYLKDADLQDLAHVMTLVPGRMVMVGTSALTCSNP